MDDVGALPAPASGAYRRRMSSQLHGVSFDAHDPVGLAAFWGGLLRRPVTTLDTGAAVVEPVDLHDFALRFWRSDAVKRGPNQMHPDLTSRSPADQEAIVGRALELGARHLDIGQGEVDHVVLADPEGNKLCVIAPGNRFLADTAAIGALASDGTQAVGYFWSAALGWPLAWDQDEETAIQSPQGGTKISWGGPPVAPKTGRNRLHLDLVADDVGAEVRRLESLGASRLDIGQGDVGWVVLADPDGNELCVVPG